MSEELFVLEKNKKLQRSKGLKITLSDDAVKKLIKLQHGGETAIKRTVSDVRSRAPGWISKGVRMHYAVAPKDIIGDKKDLEFKPAVKIKVSGETVDGLVIETVGRRLTPTHFNMSPKQRPTARRINATRIPGQAIASERPVVMIRQPKKYRVKATIIKGRRSKLPPDTFLAEGKGGVLLPFQREGDGRTPIYPVKSLAIPQMIDVRARNDVERIFNENIEKRLNNHVKQIMKYSQK